MVPLINSPLPRGRCCIRQSRFPFDCSSLTEIVQAFFFFFFNNPSPLVYFENPSLKSMQNQHTSRPKDIVVVQFKLKPTNGCCYAFWKRKAVAADACCLAGARAVRARACVPACVFVRVRVSAESDSRRERVCPSLSEVYGLWESFPHAHQGREKARERAGAFFFLFSLPRALQHAKTLSCRILRTNPDKLCSFRVV